MGGGRWETRDGRFRIEPQAGTWMVIDTEQSDDLGLPLVRGPFRSLTAAREAITDAVAQGPTVSPLAGIVKTSKARSSEASSPAARAKRGRARPARPERPTPEEPAWLARLEDPSRRQAQRLLRRLEEDGVSDPEAIVRAEVVDGQSALARFAIERRLAGILASTEDPQRVARDIVACLVRGEEAALGVRWGLTDAEGRPIRRLGLQGAEERPRRSRSRR
jgi:hypothetical protein